MSNIKDVGHVAALVRSHVNGLQPFESTIKQTTETIPPPLPPPQPKINNSCCDDDKTNYKLTRAVKLRCTYDNGATRLFLLFSLTYSYVTTKIFEIDGLPNFLRLEAPFVHQDVQKPCY